MIKIVIENMEEEVSVVLHVKDNAPLKTVLPLVLNIYEISSGALVDDNFGSAAFETYVAPDFTPPMGAFEGYGG